MKKLLAFAAVLFCATCMAAQSSTGSVYGTVVDPKGLAVVGATVTIRSTDLSSTRTTTSDSSGGFSVAGLVPGAYVVDSEKKPLKLRRAIRLTIGLGSSTQVAVKLEVAAVKQSATVTARAGTSEGNTTTPPINQSEASVSTFLAGLTVTYLPNRDRDVGQFNQLSAEAHETDEGLSVDGQRTNALLTQVDSVPFNSSLFGAGSSAEEHIFFLPQTVVREFQIVSSGATVEAGETSAGFVNVATKEGSNRLHGEEFYTVRPPALTSADAFGNSPSNWMNNFGGSEGGAIRKGHSFFYAGAEFDILQAPTFTVFAPQAAGVVVPPALATLQGQILERDTPLSLFERYDEIMNEKNTLNIEVAGSRARSSNVDTSWAAGDTRTLAALSTTTRESGHSAFAKAGLTSVINTHSVNQASVAWISDHRGVTPRSTAPEFFINGFGELGGSALGSHLFTSQQVLLADSFSVSKGKSLFSFGATFEDAPSYEQREENLNGRFDYDSLTMYLAHQPRRFQQTFVMGNPRYSASVQQVGLFANGHFELSNGLTLTAGIRWDEQINPHTPPLINPSAALARMQSIPNDLTQWQPRAGLAWSVSKRTVVRISSGLFDAPTPATIFHRVFVDNGTQTVTADSYFDPALLSLANVASASPTSISGVPIGLSTPHALVEGISPSFRNPRSFQTAMSADETISPKLTLRAEYLHASTWRLEQALDENLSAPTVNGQGVPQFLSARPIAGVGRFLVHQSTAHASYDGATLSIISQISRRSQITANYTLSHTYDDDSNSGPYDVDSALNPFSLRAERAFSNLDVRNVLNIAGIFNLPAGFKLNPLVVVQSGAPYTGIVGFDTQNDANDFNDRAVVNGLETPRNLYRQPFFFDGDVRLVKDFTLKGEGHHLDLFMDVFNVTGTSNKNFGGQQVSLFGNAANPVFSAGQALFAPGVTKLGGPREFQFTARLVGF